MPNLCTNTQPGFGRHPIGSRPDCPLCIARTTTYLERDDGSMMPVSSKPERVEPLPDGWRALLADVAHALYAAGHIDRSHRVERLRVHLVQLFGAEPPAGH